MTVKRTKVREPAPCSEEPKVRKVNGMTAFERYIVDCDCGYALVGNTEEAAVALWHKHKEGLI